MTGGAGGGAGRKILLLLCGHGGTALLLFARNLAVARLIAIEDYGIAATFALAMAVVEMASTLGLQQMIVQDRAGEDPRFQATLQGFHLLRGALAALVLYLAAGAIADFLRIPELAWAYQVLALVPLLNGVQHFDMHRLNRAMRFGPLLLVGVVPAGVSLLAVWPLALWLGDHRVMLGALLVQAGLALAVSHLVAERPYRLAFDRAVIARALAFGWPLLVNGVLLFAVFQGDKLIVGREMGMAALALFAMGMTLTLTPGLVAGKALQNLFLPLLSARAGARETDAEAFGSLARAALQATFLSGGLLVLAVLALGPWLIAASLGEKYAALIPLLALFAAQQAVRLCKTGPNLVALACGRAVNAMLSNAVRVAALPLAWWVVVQGGDLAALLLVGLAAELLGLGVALAMMRAGQGVGLCGARLSLAVALATCGLAGALGLGLLPVTALWGGLGLALAGLAAAPDLRRVLFARAG